MDATLLKQIASGIAFALTFLLFLPYIRSIRRGKIVPLQHYSWATALFPAAVGIACLFMVFFLFIRRTATTDV